MADEGAVAESTSVFVSGAAASSRVGRRGGGGARGAHQGEERGQRGDDYPQSHMNASLFYESDPTDQRLFSAESTISFPRTVRTRPIIRLAASNCGTCEGGRVRTSATDSTEIPSGRIRGVAPDAQPAGTGRARAADRPAQPVTRSPASAASWAATVTSWSVSIRAPRRLCRPRTPAERDERRSQSSAPVASNRASVSTVDKDDLRQVSAEARRAERATTEHRPAAYPTHVDARVVQPVVLDVQIPTPGRATGPGRQRGRTAAPPGARAPGATARWRSLRRAVPRRRGSVGAAGSR